VRKGYARLSAALVLEDVDDAIRTILSHLEGCGV
jgi:hypothetical protein